MKLQLIRIIASIAFTFYASQLYTAPTIQDDTVKAIAVWQSPVFDGAGTDSIWQKATWQNIDQFWLPWQQSIDSTDFYGRYKVLWDPGRNYLYFLVEINDDQLVTGYSESKGSSYPNYDCVELFIDEDRSGGDHKNDHNAFALHITSGNQSVAFHAMDLEGGDPVNLDNMIPQFERGQEGDYYTWEFALQAHDATYNITNPEESRVTLVGNKVIGLSMAYCENDGQYEQIKSRDNFIGSVDVSEENKNAHWQDASLFGVLKLLLPENNLPPVKMHDFEDLFISDNTGKLFICTLNTVFQDPDGAHLKYEVFSNDSNLVPSFNNNFLFLDIEPSFKGTATLSINATDGEFTVGDTFLITTMKTLKHDKKNEPTIEVFPNPFNDVMFLTLSNWVSSKYEIILIDPSGKIYYKKKIHTSNFTFMLNELKRLNPGIYYLNIIGDNINVVKPIVKQ